MDRIKGKYTSGKYNYSQPTEQTIEQVEGEVCSQAINYAQLKTTLSRKTEWYQQQLSDLMKFLESEVDVEQRRRERSGRIQSLALDLASDFAIMAQYKLDSPSSYIDKIIDPFVQTLRDMRASLNLAQAADEA